MTRPVGHLARACSPHIIGHWLDVGSIRRGILCVKRYNSISIQQVAAYILRVVSSYVRLCAEKQNCCPVLVAGHRGPAICAGASCSAIFPPRAFFLKIPPTEKVSANAVMNRTLRRQPCARGCCCANAATRTPHGFAFFVPPDGIKMARTFSLE